MDFRRLVENFRIDMEPDYRVNAADLQAINEDKFARLMDIHFKAGFIIVSAERSPENQTKDAESPVFGLDASDPRVRKMARLHNEKNDKELKQKFLSGLSYMPTWGGYKEDNKGFDETEPEGPENLKKIDSPRPEKSYIVTNLFKGRDGKWVPGDINKLKMLGVQIAKQFNQDSFLIKYPSTEEKPGYGELIKQDGSVDFSFNHNKTNDFLQDYYTELRKSTPRFKTKNEKGEEVMKRERVTVYESCAIFVSKRPKNINEARERFGEIFV